MHELAVTESLLKTACEYADENNSTNVLSLNITIGALSGIIGDSVQFYWDIINKDTICENSKLNFNIIQAMFLCRTCKNEFEIQRELLPCPNCSGMDLKLLHGDEFLLESIEMESSIKDDGS